MTSCWATARTSSCAARRRPQTDAIKFSVIDPPTAPRVPIAPNRPMLLTGVLIAGIVGGIGAAFAMGQLQTDLRHRGTARTRHRHAGDRLDRRNGDQGPDGSRAGASLPISAAARRRWRWPMWRLLGVEMLQRGLAA